MNSGFWQNTRLRLIGAALLSLGLSACGGGGGGGGSSGSKGGSSSPPPAPNYQPMAVGDRWIYKVTYQDPLSPAYATTYMRMRTATGTQDFGGTSAFKVQTRDPLYYSLQDESYFAQSATALSQYYLPGTVPANAPSNPVTLLHLPLVVGDSYDTDNRTNLDVGADFDYDGINETYSTRTTVTVVGYEDVTVPAGTFRHTLKVVTQVNQSVHYSKTNTDISISSTTTEWMADGIGDVKRDKISHWPSQNVELIYELSGYSVGGTRSETTPPDIVQSSPTIAGTNNAWTPVNVQFSEFIDPERVTNQTFVLLNSSGQPVSGTLTATSQSITFTPTNPLPTDTYIGKITNLYDLLGNALTSRTWSFPVTQSAAGDPLNYFPLAVGNRWAYNVSGTHHITTYPQSYQNFTTQRLTAISGTHSVAGVNGVIQQELDPDANTLIEQRVLAKSNIAVSDLFDNGQAPFGIPFNQIVRVHFPILPTDSYTTGQWLGVDTGSDMDGDGINETVDITYSTNDAGTGTITVAAGSFPQSVNLQYTVTQTLHYSRGNTATTTVGVNEWRAPSIGVVKSTRTTITDSYTDTLVYELSAYRLNGVSSDTTPPSVTGNTPATYTTSAGNGISISLSETPDLGRLAEASFSVKNGTGALISGALTGNGQQITFNPAQPLADGSYTVVVSNVFDLMGNPLPPFTWNFVVDTTPPVVVSTSPANGDANVSNQTGITATFSEPMTPGALNLWTMNPVPVQISGLTSYDFNATVSGNSLNITIPQILKHGTTYNVMLGTSLKDAHGIPMANPYGFSFTTRPGLVADPVLLYRTYATIAATAIGDVNGDGRQDLVIATSQSQMLSGTNQFTLFVFNQNPDGTLAAPLTTSTSTSSNTGCIPTGLAIGDVTGDGQADIVLAEGGCGLKIFQRMPDGSWPRPPETTTSNGFNVRVADMNGDGLPDIVGFHSDFSSMSVWYQQAGGGIGPETVYTLPAGVTSQLALADANGDGRIDLVFVKSHGSTSNDQFIGVMTQAAGGGFNAPVYYDAGGGNSAFWSFNVGDLNNDGRPDVVIGLRDNSGIGTNLGVLYQQPDGSLGPITYTSTGSDPMSLFIGDFNHDGRNDVLATMGNIMGIHLQNSGGALTAGDLYMGTSILATGDLNGDGRPDVVTGNYGDITVMYNIVP